MWFLWVGWVWCEWWKKIDTSKTEKKDSDSAIELEEVGEVEQSIDCIVDDKFVCECGPFDVASARLKKDHTSWNVLW